MSSGIIRWSECHKRSTCARGLLSLNPTRAAFAEKRSDL